MNPFQNMILVHTGHFYKFFLKFYFIFFLKYMYLFCCGKKVMKFRLTRVIHCMIVFSWEAFFNLSLILQYIYVSSQTQNLQSQEMLSILEIWDITSEIAKYTRNFFDIKSANICTYNKKNFYRVRNIGIHWFRIF